MTLAVLRHLQYRANLTQKISVEIILEELANVESSIHMHKVTKDLYRVPGYLNNNVRKIYKAFSLSRSQNVEILEMDCRVFLKGSSQPFDILFIDPPYQSELLWECFSLLEGSAWLKPDALIYFESNKPIPVEKIPKDWKIIRERRAGKVYFYLAKKFSEND